LVWTFNLQKLSVTISGATETIFWPLEIVLLNSWWLNIQLFFVTMCQVQLKLFQTYSMPPFQIQSLVTKKFQSPSNDQDFLDGNWNPLMVMMHMVTKDFRLPIVGQLKPFFFVASDYFFFVINPNFWLPLVVTCRVWQEIFENMLHGPFSKVYRSWLKNYDHHPMIKISWMTSKTHFLSPTIVWQNPILIASD